MPWAGSPDDACKEALDVLRSNGNGSLRSRPSLLPKETGQSQGLTRATASALARERKAYGNPAVRESTGVQNVVLSMRRSGKSLPVFRQWMVAGAPDQRKPKQACWEILSSRADCAERLPSVRMRSSRQWRCDVRFDACDIVVGRRECLCAGKGRGAHQRLSARHEYRKRMGTKRGVLNL